MVRKAGPVGGPGGGAVDMNINGDAHIVKIIIRCGSTIDSITTFFQRNGGVVENTVRWGGEGGGVVEVNFLPHEIITSVSGHVGTFNGMTVVRSLKFTTNVGTHGPYGGQEGMPFDLAGEVVGFYGRAGQFVDALGVYVKCT